MLDQLLAYAEAQGVDSEPGFAARTVKWAIACDDEGRYTGLLPLGEAGRGRRFHKAPQLSQPELIGGKSPRSHFLVEALSTVALWLKDDSDAKARVRAQGKQDFFCALLRQCDPVVPGLAAAASMLADSEQRLRLHNDLAEQKAKDSDLVTLYLHDALPLDSDAWYDWWRDYRAQLGAASVGPGPASAEARCLLTGDLVAPAATHPKIKGLAGVGGLGMGDVLVGFDKAAFQSYGLDQSANAAMSTETAVAYTGSLNQLIAERGVKLGGTLAVHWFKEQVADPYDLVAALIDPSANEAAARFQAAALLDAIHSGERPDLAGNRYYALLLSGAAGRVMVRDWMEGAFEELAAHIDAWFGDLAIVDRDGGRRRRPKFLAVAGSLVRDLKELPPPLLLSLWHSALQNRPIPAAALARAVARARVDVIADNPANPTRMGLIKAFHLRKGDTDVHATANHDHPSPAYHCGRLLAVLARLQRAALGDVGAGVVQRYYTAASQTPALVIGRLIANAKNHLNKLDGGLPFWFEEQISAVMSRIGDAAPRTLSLEQQSLFALGYYQQLAEMRTKKTPDTGTPNQD